MEVIGAGVVALPEDVKTWLECTLLFHQSDWARVHRVAKSGLNYLQQVQDTPISLPLLAVPPSGRASEKRSIHCRYHRYHRLKRERFWCRTVSRSGRRTGGTCRRFSGARRSARRCRRSRRSGCAFSLLFLARPLPCLDRALYSHWLSLTFYCL